jgi:lysophospholipase L1-like esterase
MNNATFRMIARSTIAGGQVRVRLQNIFGETDLIIGEAWLGLRNGGGFSGSNGGISPALVRGSNRQIFFNYGDSSVTIPPGGDVKSDPVNIEVEAQQDLAVSLYVPGKVVEFSEHQFAFATSYITDSGEGDRAREEDGASFTVPTKASLWLAAIDVRSKSTGAIVAFGDSLTDGQCSTDDGHDRWVDILALRLRFQGGGNSHKAVVNAGISGNTLIMPSFIGSPGVLRLERDVLSLAGVTHVILFFGVNDLVLDPSPEVLIDGMGQITDRIYDYNRVNDSGVKIIGGTITPASGFSTEQNTTRRKVNDWIRNTEKFNAVINFDEVIKDLYNPDRINPVFDCGDGLHHNIRGHFHIGESIDLSIFKD